MTPLNVFYMVLAAGTFAVLCFVAYHLVLVLMQVRRTAASMEVFLESTRPRVEATADKLDSLISRADNLLSGAEQGEGLMSSIINGLGSAIGGFTAGGKVISMISASLAGIVEAWRALRERKEQA